MGGWGWGVAVCVGVGFERCCAVDLGGVILKKKERKKGRKEGRMEVPLVNR